MTNVDITGIEGAELAPEIDMVGNDVNGISMKIKKLLKSYISNLRSIFDSD